MSIAFANEQGAFLLQEAPSGDAVYANHNLYISPAGNADGFWIWNGQEFDTFDGYRALSGNDADSLVADPRFVAAESDDFGLREGSPCIDTGNNSSLPEEAQTDHSGEKRMFDGDADGAAIVDIDAFEFARGLP